MVAAGVHILEDLPHGERAILGDFRTYAEVLTVVDAMAVHVTVHVEELAKLSLRDRLVR